MGTHYRHYVLPQCGDWDHRLQAGHVSSVVEALARTGWIDAAAANAWTRPVGGEFATGTPAELAQRLDDDLPDGAFRLSLSGTGDRSPEEESADRLHPCLDIGFELIYTNLLAVLPFGDEVGGVVRCACRADLRTPVRTLWPPELSRSQLAVWALPRTCLSCKAATQPSKLVAEHRDAFTGAPAPVRAPFFRVALVWDLQEAIPKNGAAYALEPATLAALQAALGVPLREVGIYS